MKLPSGVELTTDQLTELFETVCRWEFEMQCPFHEAFELAAEDLSEGQYPDTPALTQEDLAALNGILAPRAIDCTQALNVVLVEHSEKLKKHLNEMEVSKP